MKVKLINSVQDVIDSLISEENYITPPDVEAMQGSQAGDGYASKTYAISIKSEYGKNYNLFVKYLPEGVKSEWKIPFHSLFTGEFNFYNKIFPALDNFQKKKNVKEPFDNVPKHFPTKINNDDTPPIVLENLRSLGYTLKDLTKPIDDAHLKLPIKAFARFHAISYAMKDQDPKAFKKLVADMGDFYGEHACSMLGMDNLIGACVQQFTECPTLEKDILDRCANLKETLSSVFTKIPKLNDEYAAITQGDCWSNNMMFLYDDEIQTPIDVKLIDWQCQRYNSPTLDLAYFFYTLATKKELENIDVYLNLYYNTLSERIKELGSDPEKLYPYEIFMKHWDMFSTWGLCMAFFVIKAQLFQSDEIPELLSQDEPINKFFGVVKNQDKYVERMRDLVVYFINKDYI